VRLVWQAWLAFMHRAGSYQSTVLLNVVYFALFGPCAVLARLCGTRLLDLGPPARHNYWLERRKSRNTLVDLTRQF